LRGLLNIYWVDVLSSRYGDMVIYEQSAIKVTASLIPRPSY